MSADQIKDSGVRQDTRLRNANLSLYGSLQRGEHKITIPNAGDDAALLLSKGNSELANLTIAEGGYLNVDSSTAAVAAAGTVALNKMAGRVTVTLSAAVANTVTITNSQVAATDLILLTRVGGNEAEPAVLAAVAGAGTFDIVLTSADGATAFTASATIDVAFLVLKA